MARVSHVRRGHEMSTPQTMKLSTSGNSEVSIGSAPLLLAGSGGVSLDEGSSVGSMSLTFFRQSCDHQVV
jgi:hypothetical protein